MTKSLRVRQKELREEEILTVARRLLLEQGYSRLNMDELAAQVGIAKMTLYQHFSSKETLVVHIIVREMRQVEGALSPVFSSNRPALERLEEIIRESFARRMGIRRVVMELAPAVVLQHPAYIEQMQRLSTQWGQLIDQAKAEGTIEEQLATPVLVRLLFHMLQTDYDDLLSSGMVSEETLAQTLIPVVLKGIRV